MKTNFWHVLLLSSVLTVSFSRSNTFIGNPNFSITNATGVNVTVEARQNNVKAPLLGLPNNGVLPARQTWQLSLVSTGGSTSTRGRMGSGTTKYYHLYSIKATIPASGNTPAIVGERKKNTDVVREKEGGMTDTGRDKADFYIVRPGPSAPNLQIVRLIQ